MQCLQLTRGEPPAITTPVAVTITGSGTPSGCYATINGTKQYIPGTYEVYTGDTITFGVYGISKINGSVTIDGTEVLIVSDGKTQTYDWTVPSGVSAIEIAMRIKIQSPDLPEIGIITVTTA